MSATAANVFEGDVPLPTVSKPELMPGGSDAEFRSFIQSFLAFSARVNQIRGGFGGYVGLSGIAYTTLMSISHLEGEEGVGVSRVAEHLHLSGAFVTIEVAKLVETGLVQKRTNDRDRRRVLLTVTEKGHAVIDALAPLQVPVNDALFECLTGDEFRLFAGMLERLVECGDRAHALLGDLSEGKAAAKPAARPPRRRKVEHNPA